MGKTQRHKVFVSYHHENDQQYKDKFKRIFANHYDILESRSVEHDDIDPNDNQGTDYITQQIRDKFIRDATVIVVLIGKRTWQRKFVDREIYSGLRDSDYNPRCGLLGLLLPTYRGHKGGTYDPHTIPQRLYDNAKEDRGFAKIYTWTETPRNIQTWIDIAYRRRKKPPPPVFRKRPMLRRDLTGSRWPS